jgi:sec-independent protein translocase protein TatA
MFRNLGEHPVTLIVLLLVVLLLFGANRLPGLAKSVGQSLKIFKSEVKDLRTDDAAPAPEQPAPNPTPTPGAAPQTPAADGGRAPNA